jgi:hypothetical protein
MRTGYAQLPLHAGRAPRWLFERMVRLAREVARFLVTEHGTRETLLRLSDPYWFQAFGCVLGFDWHSSGLTTTVCGALKEGLKGLEGELGLYAAGGKGAVARRTPLEIEAHCQRDGLAVAPLVYASRMAAKVDSACVQDGYALYHHALFFDRQGRWCVVQQGMHALHGMARRYHWLGEGLESFVEEPHAAVCCDRREPSFNLVAQESAAARQAVTELAARPDREVNKLLPRLPELVLPRRHGVGPEDVDPARLHKVLLATYERAPKDFEGLLGIPGLGAKSLRALALVAELVYGARTSLRDPARFSFAHGGKDGTPYPVDRAAYDHTIDALAQALRTAQLDGGDKALALKRLHAYAERAIRPAKAGTGSPLRRKNPDRADETASPSP